MEEIWKDIVIDKNGIIYDYTGLYQVSNLGRVRKQEVILKTQPNKNGYIQVGLNKNGKRSVFYVHRLVATMFIQNPDNLPVVNHKDENKTNNGVDNLEWCDAKYNANYGSKLERQSEKMKGKFSGDKNPMYGKERTEEWRKQHSATMKGKYKGSNNPNAKKVLCVETGQIFECIKDAKKWLGKGNISACLNGETKTSGGYHWQYVD